MAASRRRTRLGVKEGNQTESESPFRILLRERKISTRLGQFEEALKTQQTALETLTNEVTELKTTFKSRPTPEPQQTTLNDLLSSLVSDLKTNTEEMKLMKISLFPTLIEEVKQCNSSLTFLTSAIDPETITKINTIHSYLTIEVPDFFNEQEKKMEKLIDSFGEFRTKSVEASEKQIVELKEAIKSIGEKCREDVRKTQESFEEIKKCLQQSLERDLEQHTKLLEHIEKSFAARFPIFEHINDDELYLVQLIENMRKSRISPSPPHKEKAICLKTKDAFGTI